MPDAVSTPWKLLNAKTGSGSAACAAHLEAAQAFTIRHLPGFRHRRSVIPDRGAAVSDAPATSPQKKEWPMTSLVLHPQHECAPRVIRTLAMACAIALNLTALLIALRPLPLTPIALPVVQPSIRTILVQPPHALPIPPPPVLQPVHHRVPHSTATLRVPQPIADVSRPVANPVTQPVAQPSTSTGSSDATIAYETATPPPYPIAEVRAGVQGTVLLRVLVD